MRVDVIGIGNPTSVAMPAHRELQHANNLAFQDQIALNQVSSRPQINQGFAATTKHSSLLAEIDHDPGNHLQTLGDFGLEQRKNRDASIPCQLHNNEQLRRESHAKTFRSKICSCEKLVQPESNNLSGLTPMITKSARRTFSANIWLCQDHPLSIETFLPLLQVLSFSSKQIRKLEQSIARFDLPRDRFPLKAKVPVFMLVEATFQFQNLQFGVQPQTVFNVDERVMEKKRESMRQHYQAMLNGNKKSLTFHSEEDQIKHNQTLTRLYKQLSLPDSEREDSREHSSLSDGIELAYKMMLSEPDEDTDLTKIGG